MHMGPSLLLNGSHIASGGSPPLFFKKSASVKKSTLGSIILQDFNPTRVREGEVFINFAYIMPTQRKRAYRKIL